MLAEFAAPPVVPIALLGMAGLLLLFGHAVATGMLKAWDETFGTFLRWLANKIDVGIPTGLGHIHPLRSVANFLRGADKQVRNAFAAVALRCEHGASWCFTEVGIIWHWMAAEVADLAHDVFGAIQQTTVATIPNAVRRAEAATLAKLRGIDHAVGRIEAQAKAQLKRLQVGIDRIGHGVTVTLPHAIAGVRARVGAVERWERTAKREITRLDHKVATRAFAAAVVTALTAKGLGCLFGRNGRKAVKSLCHMPSHWLDEVLGLLVDFYALTHICQVIPWLEQGFELVAAPLITELGKAGAGLCGAGYSRAPRSTPPKLYLPAVSLDLHVPE